MTEAKKDFPELDYGPFEKSTAELTKDKTISFNITPIAGSHRGETKRNTATLYWDENRQLWLAKVEGEFLESEFDKDTGGMLYLPYTAGPFALNLFVCKKILEAYSLPENRINIRDVPRLSPSESEKLAESSKGVVQTSDEDNRRFMHGH